MAGRSFLSIDVKSSRELQAVILALRQTDSKLVSLINKQSKAVILPEWAKGVQSRVSSPAERVILGQTARVAVSNSNVALRSAGVNATLTGGLSTKDPSTAGAIEFGANRAYTKTYPTRIRARTAKQTIYFVHNRHTQRQLAESRKAGPVYRTAENIIPRVGALWVSTVVKAYRTAFEGSVL